jgi:hypothetical protein
LAEFVLAKRSKSQSEKHIVRDHFDHADSEGAPTITSSEAAVTSPTVVNAESTCGVPATPTPRQRTSNIREGVQANGSAAQWTNNETARLIHVVCDPSVAIALARHASGLSRAQLDAKLKSPFVTEFLDLYNDATFTPAHPDPKVPILKGIDPCDCHRRVGNILSDKYTEIRKLFTVAYENWSCSGQNDPTTFASFCQGKKMVDYAFRVWKDLPALQIVLKSLPAGTPISVDQSRIECTYR